MTDQATTDRIAALAPGDLNEYEIATQCIAARDQADNIMRLIRLHASDIALVIKLNAQYIATVRSSQLVHRLLMDAQQQRREREATPGAVEIHERTRRNGLNAMVQALAEITEAQAALKTNPKSPAVKSETPVRQPTNRVIDLHPTRTRTLNQDWPDEPADGNSENPDRPRVIH